MKGLKLILFFIFSIFVNILLQGQDRKRSKYPEHPFTAFNINLGLNTTASARGSLAPGYMAGIDFEHHFKSNPFGFNLGFRNMKMTATTNSSEFDFWIAEFFGKISYRISKDPTYLLLGYSSGKIYEYQGFLPGLETRISFLNFGAEHKFFVPEKLLITAGINYKLTNIYDREFGFLNTLEVVFKFGKI